MIVAAADGGSAAGSTLPLAKSLNLVYASILMKELPGTSLQGYAVGPSQMDFQISVSVTTASAGQKPTTQVLTLSPSTPTIVSANNTVSAKLLGDLAAYGTLPSFEYSYLMVPQNPGG